MRYPWKRAVLKVPPFKEFSCCWIARVYSLWEIRFLSLSCRLSSVFPTQHCLLIFQVWQFGFTFLSSTGKVLISTGSHLDFMGARTQAPRMVENPCFAAHYHYLRLPINRLHVVSRCHQQVQNILWLSAISFCDAQLSFVTLVWFIADRWVVTYQEDQLPW